MALVDFLVDLARNLALLLALTLLYSVVRRSWTRARPALRAIFAGGVFGLIAIAGMHTPFVVAPGVLADARYIPLLLAGPFGGPGAAVTVTVGGVRRGFGYSMRCSRVSPCIREARPARSPVAE